jgi:hypothetical protein
MPLLLAVACLTVVAVAGRGFAGFFCVVVVVFVAVDSSVSCTCVCICVCVCAAVWEEEDDGTTLALDGRILAATGLAITSSFDDDGNGRILAVVAFTVLAVTGSSVPCFVVCTRFCTAVVDAGACCCCCCCVIVVVVPAELLLVKRRSTRGTARGVRSDRSIAGPGVVFGSKPGPGVLLDTVAGPGVAFGSKPGPGVALGASDCSLPVGCCVCVWFIYMCDSFVCVVHLYVWFICICASFVCVVHLYV